MLALVISAIMALVAGYFNIPYVLIALGFTTGLIFKYKLGFNAWLLSFLGVSVGYLLYYLYLGPSAYLQIPLRLATTFGLSANLFWVVLVASVLIVALPFSFACLSGYYLRTAIWGSVKTRRY